MKNKTAIKMAVCGCLAAFALVSAASAAFFSMGTNNSEGFILRDHEGHIAIYSAAKQREMLTLTDIDTSALPSADRLELEKGIFAEDNEALLLLLEDFGS